MKRYKHYTDARHGWVGVKRQELIDLGIINDISPYSYQNGSMVYLEEDVDARRFIVMFEYKNGIKPLIVDGSYQDSHYIRRYERFSK